MFLSYCLFVRNNAVLSESIDHLSNKTYIIIILNTTTAINKTAPLWSLYGFGTFLIENQTKDPNTNIPIK